MKCGGFRVSYRSDEQIFDTYTPRVALVVFLGLLFTIPRFASTYELDVLNRIGIAIIGALGLNILIGYTGQISIGHAAFLAVGAYTTAVLEAKVGLPFYLAIPAAALLTRIGHGGAVDIGVSRRAGFGRVAAEPELVVPEGPASTARIAASRVT